jgi:hypothetical protein
MLKALIADAIFCVALFFETLSALSILQFLYSVKLRYEFDPILAFYHAHVTPVLAVGVTLIAPGSLQWFADASVIATVLFYLFFIAQARRATSPQGDASGAVHKEKSPVGVEAAIDWLLPAFFCAIGALVLAPTLLAFLTLPVALFLAIRRIAWTPSWFYVSRTYYANVLLVALAVGAVLSL